MPFNEPVFSKISHEVPITRRTKPPFTGKDPAFLFYPFLRFFFTVAILPP